MPPAVTVSTLFTDLVDSTAIATRLGPVDAEALRQQHFGLLRSAIGSAGGKEVKSTGDGLMVVFDSASAALDCAIAMQRAIARRNRGAAQALSIRVGISHGEADREDEDFYGPSVTEAARLCAAASGDEILVSELMRMLVGPRGSHHFTARGELDLKGFDAPVLAHGLEWHPRDSSTRALPVGLSRAGSKDFIDRDEARSQVMAAAGRAARGDARFVMIGGEPGIGKTRLAAEMAAALHTEGNAVLFGRCSQEPLLPYEPFVEALRDHASLTGADELGEETTTGAGLLARFIPELAGWLPRPAEPVNTDPVTERLLLFEAVGAWLDAIAERQGFVTLVVDDLHWADPSTLQLLSFLARRVGSHHLLVLGTFRETEIERTDPLGRVLADLRRVRAVERVSLRGLDADAVAALIRALGDEHPTGALAEVIRDGTDGNPFFVEEVVVNLRESGSVVVAVPNERRRLRSPLDALAIPDGVRDIVGQRLGRLGAAANAVLALAAVCGRSFHIDVLTRAGGFSYAQVLDALDAAIAAQLVVEEGDLPGRYQFAHALVRQTLYDELTSTRRAVIHADVADAIEAVHAPNLDDHRGQIAHHRLAAASIAGSIPAVDAAREAAEVARLRYARDEAIAWFRRARQVVLDVAPVDHRLVAHLSVTMADLAHELDEADQTADHARVAAAHARAIGDHALMGQAAWRLQYGSYVMGTTNDEVVALCDEALGGLDGEAHPSVRAHVLATLAYELASDQPERADACAREAIALARASGDLESIAPAAYVYAHKLENEGRIGDALDVLDEGLAAAIACDAHDLQLTYLMTRCFFTLAAPDVERYRAARADFDASVTQHRAAIAHHWAASLGAVDLLREGRLDLALEAIEQLAHPRPTMNDLLGQGTQIAAVLYEAARYEELEALLRGAVEILPEQRGWHAALALTLAHDGRLLEARALYDHAVASGIDQVASTSGRAGLVLTAEACALFEDAPNAPAIASGLEPFTGQVFMVGWQDCRGPYDLYLGMLRSVEGRLDEAVALLEAALECSRLIESPRWVTRASYELARVRLRRGAAGDARRARQLVDDARPIADALGLRTTAALLDSLR